MSEINHSFNLLNSLKEYKKFEYSFVKNNQKVDSDNKPSDITLEVLDVNFEENSFEIFPFCVLYKSVDKTKYPTLKLYLKDFDDNFENFDSQLLEKCKLFINNILINEKNNPNYYETSEDNISKINFIV